MVVSDVSESESLSLLPLLPKEEVMGITIEFRLLRLRGDQGANGAEGIVNKSANERCLMTLLLNLVELGVDGLLRDDGGMDGEVFVGDKRLGTGVFDDLVVIEVVWGVQIVS
ncbi:hypothetical protein HK102_002117 [Quaeritorhiza haematococci]|nr:hypothetical protein HK102_002117 [Quaeritorhiza haematococci]